MRVCRQAALLIVFVVAILAGSAGARASAIFTFVQSGGDVVGTLSGSLNLFGATGLATPSYGPTIIPSSGLHQRIAHAVLFKCRN